MNKYSILIFLLIFKILNIYGQNVELPMGFRDIVIGLNLDEAKEILSKDSYFDYRGDPDVSMLLSENKTIIESEGNVYIENGYFQFYDNKLYTITLILDIEKIDYHSIFKSLSDKYGKYSALTPKIVTWENEEIRITLEKPLTIKYVGLNVYNTIIANDTTEIAIQEKLRENFINEF